MMAVFDAVAAAYFSVKASHIGLHIIYLEVKEFKSALCTGILHYRNE
jgi:hypothetical protein